MERTSIILMLRHEFSVNSVTCDIIERTSAGREAARKKEESALADHEGSTSTREAGAGPLV
jgi:hypothetical protein